MQTTKLQSTKSERYYTHTKTYLFNFFLLLIERHAIQLQQRGGNTHCQVVGVHLVGVSSLQDVIEYTEQMLQEEFIGHFELV